MSKAIYSINLDLHKTQSQVSLAAKQGDTDREIHITLHEDGQSYKIERGAFAVLSAITPTGNVIEENCVIEDSKIIYAFTDAISAASGIMDIEIRLYDKNSKLITSPTFTLVVSPRAAVADSAVTSDSFTSLDKMYNDTNALKNEVEEKLKNGDFVGAPGAPAGFGEITAEATPISAGKPPAVKVMTDGPDTAKSIHFDFSIPTPTELSYEVDPIFANNSWETIKKVCQYDDPSKYWKVGDYKELYTLFISQFYSCFDVDLSVFTKLPFFMGEQEYLFTFIHQEFIKENDSNMMEYKFKFNLSKKGNPYYDRLYECNEWFYTDEFEKEVKKFGISLTIDRDTYKDRVNDGSKYGGSSAYKFDISSYPIQIIGFNHDKVSDPYAYGKQKAGMTLQLGVSRNMYGDTKASLFGGKIDGIMSEDGKYFKSPTSLLADFREGFTNWAEGGFRVALQTLFDGTEIAPYLTEVQKYTSQYFNQTYYYYDPILSNDKVFLPSEYEVFGFVLRAPGQEGEQYELYKDGYSRFMWSEELLNGDINGARIWLRSASGSRVSMENPNSEYCTSIYIHVHNRNPLSVSHAPSQISNGKDGVPAYIAPCICL